MFCVSFIIGLRRIFKSNVVYLRPSVASPNNIWLNKPFNVPEEVFFHVDLVLICLIL
jgi:hypothetical protein